jgi:hypothetical protein
VNTLFSFETATAFLGKCLQACRKTRGYLRKIGSIEMAIEMESWKRAKYFSHLSFTMSFFEKRIEFFLACLKHNDIDIYVAESLFRGLIEIYARTLFIINSSEDEALKRIVWQDLFIVGFSNPDFIRDPQIISTIKLDTQILKSIGVVLPPIDAIRKYVHAKLRGEKYDKNVHKIVEALRFPSVQKALDHHYIEDEFPRVPKHFLKWSYSGLSEQFHGNFLMESVDPDNNSKYRIIAFLILLALRFLKAMNRKTNSIDEIEILMNEFMGFSSDYLKLWRPFLS